MTKKGRRFDFLDDVQAKNAAPDGELPTSVVSSEPAGTGDPIAPALKSAPPFAPAIRKNPAPPMTEPRVLAQEPPRAYLYEPTDRHEAQAPLGNRVRLVAKHELEDYVRALKRAGHPATEGRVLEALMLLLNDDMVQARVNDFLTGKERL